MFIVLLVVRQGEGGVLTIMHGGTFGLNTEHALADGFCSSEEPPNIIELPSAFVVLFVACLAHERSVPRVVRVYKVSFGAKNRASHFRS